MVGRDAPVRGLLPYTALPPVAPLGLWSRLRGQAWALPQVGLLILRTAWLVCALLVCPLCGHRALAGFFLLLGMFIYGSSSVGVAGNAAGSAWPDRLRGEQSTNVSCYRDSTSVVVAREV